MNKVEQAISNALVFFQEDDTSWVEDAAEIARHKKYRSALAILQTIPSGTHEDDLTPEQKQAWVDYYDAIGATDDDD